MLCPIEPHLTTTEHCELDKQCNDAGCEGLKIRNATQTVPICQLIIVVELLLLLVWLWLHHVDISKLVVGETKQIATLGQTQTETETETETREGTLEQLIYICICSQVQQRSMGGNWHPTCKHCLARNLTITLALVLVLTVILALHLTLTLTLTFVVTFIPSLAFTLIFTPTFVFTLSPTLTFNSTVTFSSTFAQLPVCRFGRMNTKVAFTVCITFTCPYRLMCLHRTISTCIRAVDDNQVCS